MVEALVQCSFCCCLELSQARLATIGKSIRNIAFLLANSICNLVKSSCRGLFATHYHRLADSRERDPNVAICHMGCSVEDGVDGGPEQVRMLCCQPILTGYRYHA